MEDYNKIIESLGVKFLQARNIKILQSVGVSNHYEVENHLFLLHDGELSFEDGSQAVEKGDLLFVPGGRQTALFYGKDAKNNVLDNEAFINVRERCLEVNQNADLVGKEANSYSYVSFETKVFDSINFFASLDIPPFIISDHAVLARLVKEIMVESLLDRPGKNLVVKLKTEQAAVEIVRYILTEGLFVEQLATNSTYFKDPRLIDIFNYIKEYLGGDLSNKVLANVANVSEDYVGQYFKMLTGINPQDYIEYQRMEMAVNLLRTTKKSIREIGQEVGYKDTAYFCRRFKMMFGIPAGKMRRRDSLMNV